jgi:1-acyl-sn-glycerol-3-phosphate acyltransferase
MGNSAQGGGRRARCGVIHTVLTMRSPKGPHQYNMEVNVKRTIAWRVARATARFLAWAWSHPGVSGSEKVPSTGPVILAPVHRSNVDFIMMVLVTDRKPFFMARAELFDIPVLGRLISSLGGMAVKRSTATDRSSILVAEEILRRGQVLVVFPEGGLREGREVGEIADGVMFMAARTGACVVPIGIGGTDDVMPIRSKVPLPSKVRIVVGDALVVAKEQGRVSRAVVKAKSDELRSALQGVYLRSLDERP